ncbi:MAG: hypothetical protein N2C12_09730 [Planctomycetales bacterium]
MVTSRDLERLNLEKLVAGRQAKMPIAESLRYCQLFQLPGDCLEYWRVCLLDEGWAVMFVDHRLDWFRTAVRRYLTRSAAAAAIPAVVRPLIGAVGHLRKGEVVAEQAPNLEARGDFDHRMT